jgi:hypothetical protein
VLLLILLYPDRCAFFYTRTRPTARADEHYKAGGDGGPPYAAAMAMPRPRRFVYTDAVSHTRLDGPDDAA